MYKNILIATDLLDDCGKLITSALELAKLTQAKVSLLHVIERINVSFGTDVLLDPHLTEQQQLQQAQEKLERLVLNQFAEINPDNCHLVFSKTKTQAQIQQLATEQNCDLIVIGNRSRHGWELLFGSTTNDLLYKTPCNVLTVRLAD